MTNPLSSLCSVLFSLFDKYSISFNPIFYRSLCSNLDSFLFSHRSKYIVSIDWLHVIRPHHIFLDKYKPLFSCTVVKVYCLFRDFSRILYTIFFDLFVSLFTFKIFPSRIIYLGAVDIVFISHLLDASHFKKSHDFYYGNLPNSLMREGKSVYVLYLNHTKHPSSYFNSQATPQDSNFFVLPVGCDGLILLFLSLKWSFNSAFSLLYNFFKSDSRLSFSALPFAVVNSFSRGSRLGFFFNFYLNQILRPSTKCLVTTYEGFGWERLIFRTCHENYPLLTTFGYMHALLFKDQHSAFRLLGNGFDPKYILTAGSVTLNYILQKSYFAQSSVLQLGSPRTSGYSSIAPSFPASRTVSSVLVLPEGIFSECLDLFEFSIQCAIENPHITFLWRTHPLISLDLVVSRISFHTSIPDNIHFSNDSFDNDIQTSQACLYKGSTAVVTAASSGLIPIYYKPCNFPDTDPLFCLSRFRPCISSVSSFSSALYWSLWDFESINLCKNLYTPINLNFFTDYGFF